MPLRLLSLFTLLCIALQLQAAESLPRVVVSIKPVHSLVAGVMQGVAKPELLVTGAQTPHSFSLRPSHMRRLQEADLILWVGPDVESSLTNTLSSNKLHQRSVRLTALPDMPWLPSRRHADWGSSEHEHEESSHHHDHSSEIDSHIWLSPQIAGQLVSHISKTLSDMDPKHAAIYRRNGDQLQHRLQELDEELTSRLNSVRDLPYVVFHDAYHYFEAHYSLNPVGSVSVNPERLPGARHVHELRNKIIRLNARCVFSEPQFRPKLVRTLLEGTQAGSGQLDPLGIDLEPGPDAYFQLMRRLADNLQECLLRDTNR